MNKKNYLTIYSHRYFICVRRYFLSKKEYANIPYTIK